MATVYETLTRQLLESEEGAFRIGIRPITGLTATQVQAALAELAATGGGIATVSSLGAVRISTSPQDPNSPVAVEVSEKAVPSGVATLDAGGKVPSAQLPLWRSRIPSWSTPRAPCSPSRRKWGTWR